MHLPGCFSVNSALSGPSILPCCLMSQQSLPRRLPSPTHIYNQSTVCCRYNLPPPFVLLCEARGIAVNSEKTKTPPFSHLRKRDESPSFSICSQVCLYCTRGDSLHMVEHIPNADQPLSFQSEFFLLLFRQPPAMKVAPWQAVVYPSLSHGHFIILIPRSRADRWTRNVCFPTSEPDSDKKKKKERERFHRQRYCICRGKKHSVETVYGKDVLPISTSSIIDSIFFPFFLL